MTPYPALSDCPDRSGAEQVLDAPRDRETALTTTARQESHLVLDDVHSFVLRLYLNPAPGGRGRPRPQFTLEHVNSRRSQRMQSLDQVLKELSDQIHWILQGWEQDTK